MEGVEDNILKLYSRRFIGLEHTFSPDVWSVVETALEGQTFKITDGDTLQVLLSNGLKENVRLIGIDAPEKA